MGKIYKVMVHGLRGEKMIVDLCNTDEQMKNMTVKQLKEKIAQRLPDTAGEENLRLIFIDKNLDGNDTLLSDYGIQHMSVIHTVLKVTGGGGPVPERGDGEMGDKGDHRRSMEKLSLSF